MPDRLAMPLLRAACSAAALTPMTLALPACGGDGPGPAVEPLPVADVEEALPEAGFAVQGLDCDDWNRQSAGPEERMYRSRDWLRYVFELPAVGVIGNGRPQARRSEWRMLQNHRLLGALTALSALIAILALSGLWLPREWGFVAKPLTTLLIIAYAAPRGRAAPALRRWLLLGLVFSLGGDVFLLWPEQGFLPGLLSFLLAHLCYILAFCTRVQFAKVAEPVAFYAVLAGAVLSQLWPGVPQALRVPVAIYVLCLAAMAAQAAVWWRSEPRSAQARWAALGGLLFLCSDALLAINKFATPLPLASLWVLATYWVAQWCIASSLARDTA